ncbi:hypothetical protein ASPWEDRAFT_100770 [Aspergillus wentii DTO 134E9]|uniref:Uncharacterized protein n=1 Tax=Aspergillus wentii DTO 134E9 TaxID=1073089 RepID=A0A1L9S0E9_ASPWE|nr:uncharacterized protein ASPWEDRAFT_100770 [Aspergillus wentii DTO 134E9]KAI9932991.1 hypothetical protein MW887_009245 [Aspergillus wentii]OJJ40577.1 hypothetical protein ASPWEDRAFT_100770 [Aspergillus wentii DTO 134E9]
MPRKTIFLMGAPTSRSLNWDENELLNSPVVPFQAQDGQKREHSPNTDCYPVKWRLLDDRKALGGGDETPVPGRRTLFLTPQDLTKMKTTVLKDSVLDQFYNHSFAVHETSEISTPGAHPEDSMQESSSLLTDSMGTSFATSSDHEDSGTCPIPIQGPLSDLQDIPSAGYLRSIIPQTMSVNLIVSIITIQPPRRIVTRQWQKELDIVEVVVGDETRTGFGVTFWLSPTNTALRPTSRGNKDELKESLAGLRPRDIVLMRMVGLSSFQERVHGQSLRRGVTKVDLLHRQRVDASDAGGIYGPKSLKKKNAAKDEADDLPLMKVRKVREWIMRFVDSTTDRAGGDTRMCQWAAERGQALPPDTQ